jgi:hypothetical protein
MESAYGFQFAKGVGMPSSQQFSIVLFISHPQYVSAIRRLSSGNTQYGNHRLTINNLLTYSSTRWSLALSV